MRTSALFRSALFMVVATVSASAVAQDPRELGPRYGSGSGYGSGYNPAPSRTLLGLPMPQQWQGIPRAGQSRSGMGQNVPGGYAANCPNGQCQTGDCANGLCNGGRCPDGVCGTTPYANSQDPRAWQSGWSPRNTHDSLADSFRRSGGLSDSDAWTPRSGLNPVDEALNSRYRRSDLDLKSEYFGGDSLRQQELRAPVPSRSRAQSDERGYPSRRPMEAPVESFSGVARF